MDVSLGARMKELEEETRRLNKLFIEAQRKPGIVAEALAKETLRPARRGAPLLGFRLRRTRTTAVKQGLGSHTLASGFP